MDAKTLLEILPFAKKRAELYAPLLTATMHEYQINTPLRQAAFLAQIGHESGSLRYTAEIADGSAYENRKDLGNTEPGDGARYKGRGLLQITGRDNYDEVSRALGVDFVANPEFLEQPIYAARSAGWFWNSRKLNVFADFDNFGELTRRINGGLTHIDHRIKLWLVARKVLGL